MILTRNWQSQPALGTLSGLSAAAVLAYLRLSETGRKLHFSSVTVRVERLDWGQGCNGKERDREVAKDSKHEAKN